MKIFNKGLSKIYYRDSFDKKNDEPHKTGELKGELLPKVMTGVSDKTGAYLKKLYPDTLQTFEDEKQRFAAEAPPKAPSAPAAPAAAVAPKVKNAPPPAPPSEEDLKLEAETRGMSLEDLLAEKELLAEEAAKKAK